MKKIINFYYELKEQHLDEAYIEIRVKTTSLSKADAYLKKKVANHRDFKNYDSEYA